jgi:hypothetical protein
LRFRISSPRPHKHRALSALFAMRCRDVCGGEGQGEGTNTGKKRNLKTLNVSFGFRISC